MNIWPSIVQNKSIINTEWGGRADENRSKWLMAIDTDSHTDRYCCCRCCCCCFSYFCPIIFSHQFFSYFFCTWDSWNSLLFFISILSLVWTIFYLFQTPLAQTHKHKNDNRGKIRTKVESKREKNKFTSNIFSVMIINNVTFSLLLILLALSLVLFIAR